MSKRKQQTALEQQIKALTSGIKTTEELDDLTRLLRKQTFESTIKGVGVNLPQFNGYF